MPKRDETKVMNQKALQTSNGLSWIILSGMLLAISAFPFGFVIRDISGPPTTIAVTILAVMGGLYAILFGSRFLIAGKKLRLRIMAFCMILMAITAIAGGITISMLTAEL